MTAVAPRIAACVIAGGLLVATLPWWAVNGYWLHVASLICTYWVLIAGLNLVVGFSGQLSIGHVGLFAIGAYVFGAATGTYDLAPFLALALAGLAGGAAGLLLGLPSLRLPDFYFAMATMAFGLIMGELILGLDGFTGGGVGLPVAGFGAPFNTPTGLYLLTAGIAALVTLGSWNIARTMWGRGLIAVRDSTVAAQSVGIPIFRLKLVVFVFSGVTAGLAGALFAALLSYVTPDTFTLDLGLFFFVAIIVGGRGSILGPLLGTVVLTLLPEAVGALANLGALFYGLLLLLVVLLIPEGIGRALGRLRHLGRRPPPNEAHHVITPDLARLSAALRRDGTS